MDKKDVFDEVTFKECDCIARPPGKKRKSTVTNLLEELGIANNKKKRR